MTQNYEFIKAVLPKLEHSIPFNAGLRFVQLFLQFKENTLTTLDALKFVSDVSGSGLDRELVKLMCSKVVGMVRVENVGI